MLVGRGIYALKDWGYSKGTVADLIEKYLKEQGPKTKEEILNHILEQRMVKKTTVIFNNYIKNKLLYQLVLT